MMKLVLVGLVFLGAQVMAVTFFQFTLDEFQLFKLKYCKSYANPTEEEFRMKIYNENKEKIAHHNQLYYQGLVNYTMAINQFGDLLHCEFVERMTGFKNVSVGKNPGSHFLIPSNVVVPSRLDWRKKGFVTPVKNQGDCDSSWAFSTTGSLEGQYKRKRGKLVSLSAQNLVDCATDFGNRGCKGGEPQLAFPYIHTQGIEAEETYPYTGKEGNCHFNLEKSVTTIAGYNNYVGSDEDTLFDAIAAYGPISITIDAKHESFKSYSGGVYYENKCSPTDPNHSMLAVGYDTDEKGGDYWIVKNSWGEDWGEKGYIKMARNRNNNCGVASKIIRPFL